VQGDPRKARRRYSPKVEALEALRLLDASTPGFLPIPAELGTWAAPPNPPTTADAWDLALDDAQVTDLLADSPVQTAPPTADQVDAGLVQMNKYLSRSWARAGIAPQQFDDCSQAVYASLLQTFGRERFDRVMAEVSERGIPQVLNRETDLGLDFFRAIDMVKKRALRQKSFLALDESLDVPASAGSDGAAENWRGALQEAIARTLNPREADLIQATLQGFSPAEIASQWGVAPKTVSNEKTRAIQKLRSALVADLTD
jgi:RNA polymerase sigma factor (sigma-70 family)